MSSLLTPADRPSRFRASRGCLARNPRNRYRACSRAATHLRIHPPIHRPLIPRSKGALMLHVRMAGYVTAGLLRRPWLRATVAAGAVAGLAVPLVAFSTSGQNAQQDQGSPAWVGSWASSPMSGAGNIFSPGCPAGPGKFVNQTVRNIVYPSVGGDRVRIRLSNAFGTSPLTIGDASVAVAE